MDWCVDNNITYRNPRVIYIESLNTLRGIENPLVLRYADYYKHPDYEAIELMIKTMTRKR